MRCSELGWALGNGKNIRVFKDGGRREVAHDLGGGWWRANLLESSRMREGEELLLTWGGGGGEQIY